ncbi:hypothetical protein AX15_006402 [Amanita polypyramis BW_CC]|nr:hypothetical protein AX15_006402 [Amanita polypyramis BW_CC]
MYINLFSQNGLTLGTNLHARRHSRTAMKIDIFPRLGLNVVRNPPHRDIVVNGSADVGLVPDADGPYLSSTDTTQVNVKPSITYDDPTITSTSYNTDLPSVTTETFVPNTLGTIEPTPSLIFPTSDSTSDSVIPTSSAQAQHESSNQDTAAGAHAENSGSSRHLVSKPLPGGAVAGLVIGLLLLILATGVLVLRRRAIVKREKLRRTWQPKPFLELDTGAGTGGVNAAGGTGTNASQSAGNPSRPVQRIIPRVKPPPLSLLSIPEAGPSDIGPVPKFNANAGRSLMSRPLSMLNMTSTHDSAGRDYNCSSQDLARAMMTMPRSGTTMAQRRSAPPVTYDVAFANYAVVRCVFEPKLPDELRIRVGESIRVLTEYDDGWARCENVRGERGMIPLECMDRGTGGVSAYRNMGGRVDMSALGFVSRQSMRKSSLPAPRA